MSKELWAEVDHYITNVLNAPDEILEYALKTSSDAGLPAINVSAAQGKMLMVLAQSTKAHSILEIGTLGGYSTIWLARGLPKDGQLVTLEYEPLHAKVARQNLAHAGLDKMVEVIVGAAADSLAKMTDDKRVPFDLIFIDADKEGYPEYFELALKLSRPGTLIIADNVVREGAVVEPDHIDPRVQGVRKFNELVGAEERVTATIIQTVGSKGYDGFALIYVVSV